VSASEAETETSPGVLLSSGYIAGGTLCGLLLGFMFMPFRPDVFSLTEGEYLHTDEAKIIAVIAFAVIGAILLWVGSRMEPATDAEPGNG
jgi:hypothetical protein